MYKSKYNKYKQKYLNLKKIEEYNTEYIGGFKKMIGGMPTIGAKVKLINLKTKEMNERTGIIIELKNDAGRYTVKLDQIETERTPKTLMVKEDNIYIIPPVVTEVDIQEVNSDDSQLVSPELDETVRQLHEDGNLAFKAKDYESAKSLYIQALEIYHNKELTEEQKNRKIKLLTNLSIVYFLFREFDTVKSTAERAIILDENANKARYYLASAMIKLKMYDEVEVHFKFLKDAKVLLNEVKKMEKLVKDSRRRVSVLLLGEVHTGVDSAITNAKIIKKTLNIGDQNRQVPSDKIFFVSEGRGNNPIYEALKIPPRIIMREDTENQELNELISKFNLLTQVFIEYMKGDLRDPNGKIIEINWIIRKANNDGYIKLFENLTEYHNQLIEAIRKKNLTKYTEQMKIILEKLKEKYPDYQDIISQISINGFNYDLQILLNNLRDQKIIDRVIKRITDDANITHVVIIFGQIHYENLAKLIKKSEILELHPNSNM